MSVQVFVPYESAAIALGANEVAGAIDAEAKTRGVDIEVIRNGSRGATWAEPMVEVNIDGRRIAYGNINVSDIASLFDANFLTGGTHEKSLGPVDEMAWFSTQEQVIFARCGIGDATDPNAYEDNGGWDGLKIALSKSSQEIVDDVKTSGLRGRGGAGFPAGIKWQTVHDAKASQKYIVCNADEGDSGTFADRMIMECDPFTLIEGMIIAGLGVGATKGYVYLRSEYPIAIELFQRALDRAYDANWLGNNIYDSGKHFDLELFVGAGAYICGEETSLLESLEGKRGQVRPKPPLPALEGLFAKPTIINNVITLCSVPGIMKKGGEWYKNLGMGRSTGTMPFQIAGNVKKGGLVERAFGLPLRELIETYGEGTRSGKPVRAVQVGGPLGAYLPESLFDLPMDYEEFIKHGAGIGHGGIVLYDDSTNMADQARYAFEFCALESCGKCTPCRIGSVRGMEVIDKIAAGTDVDENFALIEDLCEVMIDGSLCAMGGMTPIPVQSAIEHFKEDFTG